MAKILLKRGLSSNITSVTLEQGEPAYTTDTKKLYIGDGAGGKTLINPDPGVASSADKLQTPRNFSASGDATAPAVAFNGEQNVDLALTLKNSGVAAGTYTKVTVDAKGRVTTGAQAAKADVGLGSVDNVQQASKSDFDAYKTANDAKVSQVEAIAKGASVAKVFSSVAELDTWLAVAANKATLQVGDNFYIIARDVPDYWWDGTQKQELETQKVDLADYPKTAAVQSLLDTHAALATHITAAERAAWNAKLDTDSVIDGGTF